MNQSQKNYTCKRIRDISRAHYRAIKKATVTPGSPTSLTKVQRIGLVRRGKVKMISNAKLLALGGYDLGYISAVFDFSKYEWEAKVDQKARDKKEAALDVAEDKAIDAVMLGGEEESLKAITAFSAMKF